jgi:hypothetical protein
MLADFEDGQSTLTKDSIISEVPDWGLKLSLVFKLFIIICDCILFSLFKFVLYFSNSLLDSSFSEG